MSFDPNNMKDRLKAAIAFAADDDAPVAAPVPAGNGDGTAPAPASDPASDGPSLADEAGVAADADSAAGQKTPPPDPAPTATAPTDTEQAAAALPGGFRIGNLVFDATEPADPGRLMQIQGQWKHALVVRYVHPDRTHQERSEQRHHPNRLVRLHDAGFTADLLDADTVRLKTERREVEVRMVGAVPVVL